jgi:hypothetical protein
MNLTSNKISKREEKKYEIAIVVDLIYKSLCIVLKKFQGSLWYGKMTIYSIESIYVHNLTKSDWLPRQT